MVIAHWPLRRPSSLCSPTLLSRPRSSSDFATLRAASRFSAFSLSSPRKPRIDPFSKTLRVRTFFQVLIICFV